VVTAEEKEEVVVVEEEVVVVVVSSSGSSSSSFVYICILLSKHTTYIHQHDEISIISGLHVSAVKQPSSGQRRTYTRYNISVQSYIVPGIYFALA